MILETFKPISVELPSKMYVNANLTYVNIFTSDMHSQEEDIGACCYLVRPSGPCNTGCLN